MAKRRLGKRYKRNPETTASSPLMMEMVEFIGPGFVAFAAARLLTRITATQINQRKPDWGKHAGALAAVAAFAAAWFGAHRVKWLEKYQTPIVVGSAIAGLQSLVQLYIPRLGWMVADASPELTEGSGAVDQIAASNSTSRLEILNEDPDDYTYNDSFDPGVTTQAKTTATKTDDDVIGDLKVSIEDDDISNLDLGSLAAS